MLNFLKRLFCKHKYKLNRWHNTHGPDGFDPLLIEAEYICTKCGKICYKYYPIWYADAFKALVNEYERRNQQ